MNPFPTIYDVLREMATWYPGGGAGPTVGYLTDTITAWETSVQAAAAAVQAAAGTPSDD